MEPAEYVTPCEGLQGRMYSAGSLLSPVGRTRTPDDQRKRRTERGRIGRAGKGVEAVRMALRAVQAYVTLRHIAEIESGRNGYDATSEIIGGREDESGWLHTVKSWKSFAIFY